MTPHKITAALAISEQYKSYEAIDNVLDRLRWCRNKFGYMQQDVANLLGIERSQYVAYEGGYTDYIPKEIVDKLASIYNVPVTDFLDDYNYLLYYGQGKLIREYRESLGMRKQEFANSMGIDRNSLRCWETEKKRISKDSYEKFFRGVILRNKR